jgi:hypothetical protein
MVATSMGRAPRADRSSSALRFCGGALIVAVWVSGALFGAYILALYGGAVQDGALVHWNAVLPRIYAPATPAALLGIGLHFIGGAVLLLLGPLQFFPAIRRRAPKVHRWIGRLYAGAALITGLGGLTFIALRGTIGGVPMTIGFGLYGALVVLAAIQTLRLGMARRIEHHRAWAIRLFALVIGSWLYRIDYGFWTLFTGDAGHLPSFNGWFDVVMAFFFYLPNLALAEVFIQGQARQVGMGARIAACAMMLVATGFVGLGTYFFTRYVWGPAIMARF